MIDRHGFDETVYFTFAYSAIPTAAREVGGVFTVVTETTAQVLGTRRLQALRELGEVRSVQVVDVETVCAAAIDVLGRYREDVPFAAAYLVDPEHDSAHAVASFGAESPGATSSPIGSFPRTTARGSGGPRPMRRHSRIRSDPPSPR